MRWELSCRVLGTEENKAAEVGRGWPWRPVRATAGSLDAFWCWWPDVAGIEPESDKTGFIYFVLILILCNGKVTSRKERAEERRKPPAAEVWRE